MRFFKNIKYDSQTDILLKLTFLLPNYKYFAVLNSNKEKLKSENDFDCIAGIGAADVLTIDKSQNISFDALRAFHSKHNDWIFGHLSYDLKNEIEDLISEGFDGIGMPLMTFFTPLVLLKIKAETVELYTSAINEKKSLETAAEIVDIFNNLSIKHEQNNDFNIQTTVKQRISKSDYIDKITAIKNHIQKGDIYEMNFCQEFYAENVKLNPYKYYLKLNKISPAPFSVFYRNNHNFLISSSPERYLKKTGTHILSQPIKGTAPRFNDEKKDKLSAENLKKNEKERAENIMIVDLVRNDLSRTAAKASVKVDELCEVYSFPQVHQLISTVSSELKPEYDFVDLLCTTFPMGSMTGAPKIKAMELIEKYEETKRGLYSGAVGYITPTGDFDFNVVIRSVLYNSQTEYLSFITGGAITSRSNPEREYEESMLKAKAIIESLKIL